MSDLYPGGVSMGNSKSTLVPICLAREACEKHVVCTTDSRCVCAPTPSLTSTRLESLRSLPPAVPAPQAGRSPPAAAPLSPEMVAPLAASAAHSHGRRQTPLSLETGQASPAAAAPLHSPLAATTSLPHAPAPTPPGAPYSPVSLTPSA